jgi:hypothetical protein
MGLEELKDNLKTLLSDLAVSIKERHEKCSLSAGWRLVQECVAKVVLIIESTVGSALSGPEKKEQAMEAIGKIVDTVMVIIDVPFVPEWFEQRVDKYIRIILMDIASGSIDALVTTFHDTGVFPPKETKEAEVKDV